MNKCKLSVLLMPIFFLILGIYIVVSASMMSTTEGTFPRMVGVLTVIVAGVQLYNDIKKKNHKDIFGNSNILKVTEATIVLFAYVYLLEKIGYIVDTILLSATTMYFLNYRNIKMVVISSVGFTVLVFIIFKMLLKVPLPMIFLKL